MKITAIILAGGKIEKDLERYTKEKAKAFIKINNKYMVEYTIDALTSSQETEEIILVSDKEITPPAIKEKISKIAEPGNTMIETLLNGIDVVGAQNFVPLLILPCDMPLVDSNSINEFLENAISAKTQIVYGIVEKRNYIKKFPSMKRTYLSLKDGTFCGTGFFYINAEVVNGLKDIFERITALRKKPWKLIATLGIKTIFKLLTRTLSIKHLEEKAEKILGVKVKAVILKNPAAAVNIDKVEDLVEAEKTLKQAVSAKSS